VVLDEAAVLFMGESCRAVEVQRNGDEKDNTSDSCSLCGDEPDTSLGESRYGKLIRYIMGRLRMNWK
jgi:hypothetical protein